MAKKSVGTKTRKRTAVVKKAKVVKKMTQTPGGFMWQLLKRKEAERAQRDADIKAGKLPAGKPGHFQSNPRPQRFSRFAGPRRRAA